jgi:hypothetical protein
MRMRELVGVPPLPLFASHCWSLLVRWVVSQSLSSYYRAKILAGEGNVEAATKLGYEE